ncbi:hypothetical protein CQ12_40340 [Bradyrhizobium jicamae]|uniref:Uncharacterized protein n=1 Tax=Bradyrhizobium jicamae TaxID=280332 RepID=A0A0R3M499_9BRAD|nr:hypothetical protein [Bradyrhizobium jicamae]KRR15031.1 hypothetical protein CQ12_40340 [Bradyrhizobium jicamae]
MEQITHLLGRAQTISRSRANDCEASPAKSAPRSWFGPAGATLWQSVITTERSRGRHIDILADGPISPEDPFRVLVYLDRKSRRPDEVGYDVAAPTGSLVEVELLTSSHFVVTGARPRSSR